MEERQLAICAKQITKVYKLYDKPSDRLKEALGLSRNRLYKELRTRVQTGRGIEVEG